MAIAVEASSRSLLAVGKPASSLPAVANTISPLYPAHHCPAWDWHPTASVWSPQQALFFLGQIFHHHDSRCQYCFRNTSVPFRQLPTPSFKRLHDPDTDSGWGSVVTYPQHLLWISHVTTTRRADPHRPTPKSHLLASKLLFPARWMGTIMQGCSASGSIKSGGTGSQALLTPVSPA